MNEIEFDAAFATLTGNSPFPWQHALYQQFIAGEIRASAAIPTGLGKTNVIAIWLLALATNPTKVPRRLVYVVNRRTVVDQSTRVAENIWEKLPQIPAIEQALWKLCAIRPDEEEKQRNPKVRPLAISTLRGQLADNREWSADPARPAIVVGTVDMIGSRLLFSGYGVGFKAKPLHAGFLGQDVLLVHDEAHLEPAFQKLLIAIWNEQKLCKEFGTFRVMELSATSRSGGDVFGLTKEEAEPRSPIPHPPTKPIHHVWHRLKAKKGIRFHAVPRNIIAEQIGDLALRWKSSCKAVLVFVRTVDDVATVQKVLTDKKTGVPAEQVQVLTGTLRGRERDRLAKNDPVFARFLTPSDGRSVYLICTSAGEVGVDISADHMVCDLSTLDSMVQRLGRVNRRGEGAAEVDVVYESDPEPKEKSPELEAARWKTLEILQRLPKCDWTEDRHEGSPLALRNLMHSDDEEEQKRNEEARRVAFRPLPTILHTSDILFDAWALTTIREKLPGRPMVEPYLHGISEWELPETHVAWREEVWELRLKFKTEGERKRREQEERKRLANFAAELLDDYPLKPHELLRDRTYRVSKHLASLAVEHGGAPVWVVDEDGSVRVTTLGEVAREHREALRDQTVMLPPMVGGLTRNGMLGGGEPADRLDVADEWFEDADRTVSRRQRIRSDDPQPEGIKGMRLVREIDTKPDAEEDEAAETADDTSDEEPGTHKGRYWRWYVRPRSADDDGSKTATDTITWQDHTNDVERNAQLIADALLKERPELHKTLVLAARFHDLGKMRVVWQRSIGHHLPTTPEPKDWLAKSGKGMKPLEFTDYRHEFGSLLDVRKKEAFVGLLPDEQALLLHLIAAHHGRARPHFPASEVFDPERPAADAAEESCESPRRFARLHRKYGRWGLAYLESLLRAADYAASIKPSKTGEDLS